VIGLAGTVAERFDKDPNVQHWDIYEWIMDDLIPLSGTDTELAGFFSEDDMGYAWLSSATCGTTYWRRPCGLWRTRGPRDECQTLPAAEPHNHCEGYQAEARAILAAVMIVRGLPPPNVIPHADREEIIGLVYFHMHEVEQYASHGPELGFDSYLARYLEGEHEVQPHWQAWLRRH
jgi:hypothetical protein